MTCHSSGIGPMYAVSSSNTCAKCFTDMPIYALECYCRTCNRFVHKTNTENKTVYSYVNARLPVLNLFAGLWYGVIPKP